MHKGNYKLIARCQNCFFLGEISFKKGCQVVNTPCPNCECMTLNLGINLKIALGLHPIQEKILALANKTSLKSLTLRGIGQLAGIDHPQKVAHHIQMLIKRGKIDYKNWKPIKSP